jgi:hypothetical protein
MYSFSGSAHSTVMVMTVNPAATRDTVAPFRDEAIYTFHFDTDLDGSQNVSFAVGLTTLSHANPGDLEHVQNDAVHRGIHTSGDSAEEVVASGVTGASTPERDDVRAISPLTSPTLDPCPEQP